MGVTVSRSIFRATTTLYGFGYYEQSILGVRAGKCQLFGSKWCLLNLIVGLARVFRDSRSNVRVSMYGYFYINRFGSSFTSFGGWARVTCGCTFGGGGVFVWDRQGPGAFPVGFVWGTFTVLWGFLVVFLGVCNVVWPMCNGLRSFCREGRSGYRYWPGFSRVVHQGGWGTWYPFGGECWTVEAGVLTFPAED